MSDKTPQYRHNGRFARKNIVKWKKNMRDSLKKKHLEYKNCDMNMTLVSKRRIVDLDKLAQDMWCNACDLPLSFRFLIKEDVIGLASVFQIKCHKCESIYQVKSSGSEKKSTRSNYHVNLKLALATLDGGFGETQLNTILSTLDLPTVDHNLIKRYKSMVGPVIETVAKESCLDTIKIEKE